MPVSVAATWTFSKPAVATALAALRAGGSALDAAEAGVRAVERDPLSGPYYIGKGGLPNADGVVQHDAALMDGATMNVGAVCALERCSEPVAVARLLLDNSPHSVLVGAGASAFAAAHGVAEDEPLLPGGTAAWEEWVAEKAGAAATTNPGAESAGAPAPHDTMGLVALDAQGHLVAAVSTSGMAFKAAGRVGDSPIPGSGLYADDEVGACVATGDGDNILKHCASYATVENMRLGMSPTAAAEAAIVRMLRRAARGSAPWFEVSLVAMNAAGESGAASNIVKWTDFLAEGRGDQVEFDGFPFCFGAGDAGEPVIATARTTTADSAAST